MKEQDLFENFWCDLMNLLWYPELVVFLAMFVLYIWLYVLSFESTGGLLVARSERPPVGDCKGFLKQKDNLDKVAERFKQWRGVPVLRDVFGKNLK